MPRITQIVFELLCLANQFIHSRLHEGKVSRLSTPWDSSVARTSIFAQLLQAIHLPLDHPKTIGSSENVSYSPLCPLICMGCLK